MVSFDDFIKIALGGVSGLLFFDIRTLKNKSFTKEEHDRECQHTKEMFTLSNQHIDQRLVRICTKLDDLHGQVEKIKDHLMQGK